MVHRETWRLLQGSAGVQAASSPGSYARKGILRNLGILLDIIRTGDFLLSRPTRTPPCADLSASATPEVPLHNDALATRANIASCGMCCSY